MRSASPDWGTAVGKLFTYGGQLLAFCTAVILDYGRPVGKSVGFTSSSRAFSQTFPTTARRFLYLFLVYLYPLSTPPIKTSTDLFN